MQQVPSIGAGTQPSAVGDAIDTWRRVLRMAEVEAEEGGGWGSKVCELELRREAACNSFSKIFGQWT